MRDAGDHGGRFGHGVHVIVHGVHEALDEIRHGPLVPDVRVAADVGPVAGGTRGRGQQRERQERGGRGRGGWPATARARRRGAVDGRHIIIWTRREFHI